MKIDYFSSLLLTTYTILGILYIYSVYDKNKITRFKNVE